MKHQLNLTKPIVFFDLETTGTNIIHDRVIEVCFIKANPDGSIETKNWKINPEINIPAASTEIHGISDADVVNAPKFRQLAKTFDQYLSGCDMAGYNNIKFDLPMLMEEFLRAGIDFSLANRRIVDAQKIFHLMEPRTLSAAFKFYCHQDMESIGKAHSAETDTLATLMVLNEQIKKYQGVKIADPKGNFYEPIKNDIDSLHQLTAGKMVDLAGRIAFNDKNEEVFTFGKHKDKRVAEILEKEPTYYDWMMKGDFPMDTKRKLTEIKLKMSTMLKK